MSTLRNKTTVRKLIEKKIHFFSSRAPRYASPPVCARVSLRARVLLIVLAVEYRNALERRGSVRKEDGATINFCSIFLFGPPVTPIFLIFLSYVFNVPPASCQSLPFITKGTASIACYPFLPPLKKQSPHHCIN